MSAAVGASPSVSAAAGNQTVPLGRGDLQQMIRQALHVRILPVKVQVGYRLALIGVTLVFLLNAAIYFLLLAGATLTFCYYVWMAGVSVIAFQLLAVVWWSFPVIIVGSVWLALVKPFFHRQEQTFQPVDLHPAQEPVLFEFVHAICRMVDAPQPSRIAVDMGANASASYVGGWWDHRLRLIIGLPLILGLNTRQLAGVLAHEFPHFRQQSGLWTTSIIRGLNGWFADIAFGKDQWDEFLAKRAAAGGLFGWAFCIGQLLVTAVRFLFKGMYFVSHFLTANMLRQMEFEADRFEARVAGSQVFAQTFHRVRLLNVCEQGAIDDMHRFYTEEKLPDNIPALVVANVEKIPPDKFREMERQMLQMKTEWHDTHPADRERIENAARERAPGVETLELPGEVLLSDPQGLARMLTLDYYQSTFEGGFDVRGVRSTASLVQQRDREYMEHDAAERFFFGYMLGARGISMPRLQLGENVDTRNVAAWGQQYRQQLQAWLPAYAAAATREDQLQDQRLELELAKRWFEAQGMVSPDVTSFPTQSLQTILHHHQQVEYELEQVRLRMAPFRALQGRRLLDLLEMLRSPKLTARLSLEPGVVHHVNQLLFIWGNLDHQREFIRAFLADLATLESFVDGVSKKQFNNEASLRAVIDRLHNHILVFPTFTSQLPYPFQHAKGKISIAQYLVPELPAPGDLKQIMGSAMLLRDNLAFLAFRCLSRLAWLAERVESAFGLPPIPVNK